MALPNSFCTVFLWMKNSTKILRILGLWSFGYYHFHYFQYENMIKYFNDFLLFFFQYITKLHTCEKTFLYVGKNIWINFLNKTSLLRPCLQIISTIFSKHLGLRFLVRLWTRNIFPFAMSKKRWIALSCCEENTNKFAFDI